MGGGRGRLRAFRCYGLQCSLRAIIAPSSTPRPSGRFVSAPKTAATGMHPCRVRSACCSSSMRLRPAIRARSRRWRSKDAGTARSACCEAAGFGFARRRSGWRPRPRSSTACSRGRGARCTRAGGARADGDLPAPGQPVGDPGLVSGGRQHASGDGRADGGALWAAGGVGRDGGPRFDLDVPRHGYAWWSVDPLSDDGQHGMTLIVFIGSVFSPLYAWSRRRGAGDPGNHCAVNVALYERKRRWAMTERGRAAVSRSVERLAIGPSALHWDGSCSRSTSPRSQRRRRRACAGGCEFYPVPLTRRTFALDVAGRHRWPPIGPATRVEVVMLNPDLRWSGEGYLDTNEGDRALEDDFVEWDWCRAAASDGAVILHGVTRRDGGEQTSRGRRWPGRGVHAAPAPVWRGRCAGAQACAISRSSTFAKQSTPGIPTPGCVPASTK